MVIVQNAKCKGENSMRVCDSTIQEEGLGCFFKILGKFFAEAGKKLATNVSKNPGRALENTSKLATSAAFKNRKAALSSLPKVINFYHTGNGLYFRKFV